MTHPIHRFTFAGDIVDSVIDPVALASGPPTPDVTPDWVVAEAILDDGCFDPWRTSLADRRHDTEGWAEIRPEGLLLRFPGHATFAVERSGTRVWVAPDEPAATGAGGFTDFASHLLIDHVAPRRFALLGEHVLHATCVAVDTPAGRRAIGLFGATGAGKSTLATSFVRRGAGFVADDCLLLRADASRGYSAVPSYAGARLWSDSIAGVGGAPGESPSFASWGKGRLDFDDQFDTAPVPTCAVVKLVRSAATVSVGSAAEPVLERLSPSQATVTLVGTSFLSEKGGLSTPELLRRSSELANGLPVYRLTYPSGYEHLEQAVRVLADHFGFTLPESNGPS